PPVATVTVVLGSSTLDVGGRIQANVTLRDAAGNALSGRAIAYTSSDPNVATVSASGLVTAVSPGNVSIFATSEGKSGSASLTVRAPAPVATVTVALAKNSLTVGGQTQATATLRDASGAVLSGRTITWSSSRTSIASVSSAGLVTARSTGVANIVATSEGQ